MIGGMFMGHHCEAALITCQDFRLHQRKDGRNYIAEFIKKLGVDCDLITRAGGVQDILRPEIGFAGPFLRDVHVSDALHAADIIIVVNHETCGAYDHFRFKSREEELERHHKDVRNSLSILQLLYPQKRLKGCFAELEAGSSDVFVIKAVLEIAPAFQA